MFKNQLLQHNRGDLKPRVHRLVQGKVDLVKAQGVIL
jgi:hypothetical protein